MMIFKHDIQTRSYQFEHATIVVEMFDLGNGELFPLVAGHLPDVIDYPFTAFNLITTYPIHITGY